MVSIIIPVYNVGPYLKECLYSVVTQSYKNLDVIVIDDGSSDESARICDYYQKRDSRIRVIHQENRGLSAARNIGLNMINGEIIAFLDSDDALLPDMIETMVEGMIKTNSDITICGFFICNTVNKLIPSKYNREFKVQKGLLSSKDALDQMIEGKINMSVWNKIYRRVLFDSIRFPEGCVHEDNYVTPYLLERADQILLIDTPLLIQRKHDNSITTTFTDQIGFDWLESLKEREFFVRKRFPKVFSKKQLNQFEDSIFRIMIKHYYTIVSCSSIKCKQFLNVLEQEIEKRGNSSAKYSYKTKALYLGYKLDPQFGIQMLHIYNRLRELLYFVRGLMRRRHE